MESAERFPPWMGKAPRANSHWPVAEDRELERGWNAGLGIVELAAKHGRDYGGIRSRLSRITGIPWDQIASRRVFSTAGTRTGRWSSKLSGNLVEYRPPRHSASEITSRFAQLEDKMDQLAKQMGFVFREVEHG